VQTRQANKEQGNGSNEFLPVVCVKGQVPQFLGLHGCLDQLPDGHTRGVACIDVGGGCCLSQQRLHQLRAVKPHVLSPDLQYINAATIRITWCYSPAVEGAV
jgi:hypothetical protein